MDPWFPIHVAEFQERNFSYNWIGGRRYYGNEYFYTNITRMTNANYFKRRDLESLSEVLSKTFSSLSGFISSFDLHTRLQTGFCYARYTLEENKKSVYLDRPILQIGKYNGTFPFIIEASGVYDNQVFSRQINFDAQDIFETDSLSEEAWAGNYIKSLELQTQSNDIVNEIVDYSLEERVLSIYSAFLCLEPAQGGQVCYDCLDESELVCIEESLNSSECDSMFTAYPNPFNNQVQIKVQLPEAVSAKQAKFRIYNLLGQVVRTFHVHNLEEKGSLIFKWNGKNDAGSDVASGNYFFIVTTLQKRYSLKLLFMK